MSFQGVRLLRFIYQEKVAEIPFLRPSKALDYLDLLAREN
jgi:hypothetical protein